MATAVTTAGGAVVARGEGAAWTAAQVRSLIGRGYPAFVKRDGITVEMIKGEQWHAVGAIVPPWASLVAEILNETEER